MNLTMDADLIRARNLDKGVTTVRQQVAYLLACVKRRESEKRGGIDRSLEESDNAKLSSEFAETIGSSMYSPDSRTLAVIDEEEEQSKSNEGTAGGSSYSHEDRSAKNEEENDSSESSSSCSCCQDTTNYMSTSVSIVAEETIYSPQKKEFSRAIRCARIDQSSWEFDRNTDEGEETLKSLLESRLQELEAEIDAFKTENSYLNKLRSDYEKEYNQFRKERIVLLEKIKEEHLSGVKELEKEKKRLQCEKSAFERHTREVKNRPTKQEKEEIRLLKEEIKLMKEEMNKKECRWAAAQARIRTEMKSLKDRNGALQEELKELKKTPKKVTFAPVVKRSKSFSSSSAKTKATIANKSISSSRSILRDTTLEFPSSSDSGVFSDTFQSSSNDTCDGIAETLRRSVCLSSYLNADVEKDDCVPEPSLKDGNSDEDVVSEFVDANGNREKVYADGRQEIWCANGSVKKTSADGKTIHTMFYNGDVEEVSVDENVVKYYHAASKTWHSKFGDGLEIKEFPDGQIEKYFRDGSTEIKSPNGTLLLTSATGEKKWKLIDGTVIQVNERNQEKRMIFTNGQIEIHTPEFKRREYPNGTVKTVYNGSGMQETRYPNGRIRLKSQDGTLISDTNIT